MEAGIALPAEGSLEGRLHALEVVCAHLNSQMKVMKKLVENKLGQMQQVLDTQINEIKQIIVQQDRVYQERIRRLDTRVEQLSQFALHLARQKGVVGVVAGIGLAEGLKGAPPVPTQQNQSPRGQLFGDASLPSGGGTDSADHHQQGTVTSHTHTHSHPHPPDHSHSNTTSQHTHHQRQQEQIEAMSLTTGDPSVEDILQKHSEEISNIFQFYVNLGLADKMRQTMDKVGFTQFVKDSNLCNICSGQPGMDQNYNSWNNPNAYLPPPELLWMMVLKRAFPTSSNIQHGKKELVEEQFGDALQVLAEEHYKKHDLSHAHKLEMLLLHDVIPGTKMRRQGGLGGLVSSSSDDGASMASGATGIPGLPNQDPSKTMEMYNTPAVRQLLKQYKPHLDKQFHTYAMKHSRGGGDPTRKGMTLAALLDIAKDHNIMPYTSRQTLRSIFNTALQAQNGGFQGKRGGPPKEPEISVQTYIMVTKLLAESIYGGALYTKTYGTPELRLDKLFSKLFLLKGGIAMQPRSNF